MMVYLTLENLMVMLRDVMMRNLDSLKFQGISNNYISVSNHCHHPDKYREAAHVICNLKRKHKKKKQCSFTIGQAIIIILQSNSWQKSLKPSLNVWVKTLRNT